MKTNGEKKKRGPHPGKGLPLGYVKCDHCKKPLLRAAGVGYLGQLIHAGCFGEVFAQVVGNVKKIFGKLS